MKKLLLLLIPILLMSCNCTKKATDTATTLAGNWELNYISGPKIAFDGLYPNAKPTINFDINEKRVNGKNGCNNYSGKFSLDDNTLSIDNNGMITTKMFCEGEGEKIYMNTLAKINSYSVTDNGKTLSLISGDVALMRFSAK